MEKNLPPAIAEALSRLNRAVDRLDAAAANVPSLHKVKRELSAKLDDTGRKNEILREAANRVATRLDTSISRLSQALKD